MSAMSMGKEQDIKGMEKLYVIQAWWVTTVESYKERQMQSASASNIFKHAVLFWAKLKEMHFNKFLASFCGLFSEFQAF